MQTEVKRRAVQQHSALYSIGFIGAAVYFIQHATTFWIGAWGLVKAMVWPAILVYKLLEFLAR